ncbi:MAG: nucleotidyl transferase AbiEii/AbiGii toxin family protein [Oscillospiraceae bacterium]|jgi:predicted nucleotidyltransferase component of viral defense system|nr:nucleotidyl transferase AbiEii/AbiGii toxin family protein [Oscillospiraceae bacterium]
MRNADSVKARLKQLATAENKPFDYLMTHYFVERLLYRLSVSDYTDNFILKGGLLLYTILENDARATRDVDFLANRLNNAPEELVRVFRAICAIPADDAVRFDLESIAAERLKEGADYEGVRVKAAGYLDKSRQVLQFDVGFGDVVVPKPVTMEYPSLLDMERPRIQAYSRESVIAEKFEAMIALAEVNSRMKDFYDVYTLSRMFDFEGLVLYEAVRQTLERRATPLAAAPAVFTDAFAGAQDKQIQWQAFQKRIRVAADIALPEALVRIRTFLRPVYLAVLSENEWMKRWRAANGQWE